MTARLSRRSPFAVVVLAACLVWAFAAASPPASANARAPLADVALQVSFAPDAFVRWRGNRFVALGGADVDAVNVAVRDGAVVRVERVFHSSEASVEARRRRLLERGTRGVPDLNRHYRIVARDGAQRDRLIGALARLAVVDRVVAEPRPAPPPASPSLISDQRYRTASPTGVDAAALAARAGGRGEHAKIVDIEYSWNRAHEDIVAKAGPAGALIENGTYADPFPTTNHHGTAVVGMLAGADNGFGVLGLAPDSALGLVNAFNTVGWELPNAVSVAHEHLQAGDVLLIEQQYDGGKAGDDFVPVEYWPAVYDAIRLATQDGIIVIEPAGNGSANLDTYGAPFPSDKADSGAIVVGAGGADCTTPANARTPLSSYGSRVDLQGWGKCVTSAGFGDRFDGGPNATYTALFNGTSSAAAVVAGAAALLSSVFQAASAERRAATPQAIRSRLVATGTPEATSDTPGHVGPLPNLLAAVTELDTTPPTVSFGGGPSGPTNDPTPTFSFTASEPGASYRCRIAGVSSFAPCTSPYTPAALGDGNWTVEVVASDAMSTGPAASRDFAVDTAAPGVEITGGPSGSTSQAAPAFAFSSVDAGATFECRTGTASDHGIFAPCASPHTTAPQPDGAHVFEVRAIDAAGNAGPVAAREFVVVPPAVQGSGEVTPPAPPPPAAPPPPPPSTIATPFAPPPTIAAVSAITVRATRAGLVRLPRPKVSCPALAPRCQVTAKARLAAGGAAIGATTKTVRSGAAVTLSFTLTTKARSELRRRGRLKAKVRIEARNGGALAARTVSVTIKRA